MNKHAYGREQPNYFFEVVFCLGLCVCALFFFFAVADKLARQCVQNSEMPWIRGEYRDGAVWMRGEPYLVPQRFIEPCPAETLK